MARPTNALNLDANTQKNFIRFFKNLGEKPVTTVRFFDRSDYYSVHGKDDSELIAKILFGSSSYIKIMAPPDYDELEYITLNKGSFEQAIRELLLVRNYRVEVYTNKRGRPNDWEVEFKGSPGNLVQFEEVLFGNNAMMTGNAIVAIQLKLDGNQRNIGLACVESNDCLLSICEFIDDDFFGELEATIVILGPKECILPSFDGEFARIKSLMERNGVMVTMRKKTEFVVDESILIQDLNNLLRFKKGQQKDANTLPEVSKKLAMSALTAAIKYLDLTCDTANLGHYELKQLNLNRFVHLDAAAVSALNILPKVGTNIKSPAYRWQSVLGVLDRCRTAQGHRLMAQWVTQPLRNEANLKDRLDIVQCLVESPSALSDLHDDYLKRMPDVMMLARKLMRKKATLQDIFRLYQVILRIPKLIKILLDLENVAVTNILCDPMKDTLEDFTKLKQMTEQVIDLEAIQRNEYLVKPSFDDELQELKDKMDSVERKMDKLFEKVADDLELEKGSSLKLEFVSHLGYHFRISLKDDKILRKHKKYTILDAVKGGVRFTTDKLKEYSDNFKEFHEAYEEQQRAIVEEIIKVAVGYMGPLTTLNYQIAQIDCFVSLAKAAISAPIPYVRPKILPEGSGVLQVKNLRHPCIELQENMTFIANDVDLKKDEQHMYIITGPNMGGKSTYIRSIGTAVLMAHIGSFVPGESATISMVDSILGRIGAGDNMDKGLSTFMVEMIEASAIIRTATDKSLVIIDELGRGTSTYEGCGIAWAIAEHLAKETKCFTLFATHFHEIAKLAEYVPTVRNFHMTAIANDSNFTLLYKVKPGVMDKSFGIHVARLAHFPEQTIEIAKETYEEYVGKHEDLKTEKDEKLLKELEKKVDDFLENDNLNDNEIKNLIEEIKGQIKQVDSTYFKTSYPSVFQ